MTYERKKRLKYLESLLNQKVELSVKEIAEQLHVSDMTVRRDLDELEEQGVVGPDRGGGQGRQVLLGKGIDFEEIEERLPGQEPD